MWLIRVTTACVCPLTPVQQSELSHSSLKDSIAIFFFAAFFSFAFRFASFSLSFATSSAVRAGAAVLPADSFAASPFDDLTSLSPFDCFTTSDQSPVPPPPRTDFDFAPEPEEKEREPLALEEESVAVEEAKGSPESLSLAASETGQLPDTEKGLASAP